IVAVLSALIAIQVSISAGFGGPAAGVRTAAADADRAPPPRLRPMTRAPPLFRNPRRSTGKPARRLIFMARLSCHDVTDHNYGLRASRTIVLILSMLVSRIGQLLSVATHCARPSPQPHVHRARLA